jgi:1-deoxy-D-xylulose-5-phosphate reductoisomerase
VEHVVFASSGTKAIPALQETLRLRKEVSLANKESIVVAGPWVMPLIAHPLQLRPVDSEHNAVWQALMGEMEQEREKTVLSAKIDRVYLTASGGPFRSFSSEELRRVTPEMALNIPYGQLDRRSH